MPVTLASLAKDWLSVSRDFRPSAFWFWNSDMDRDRMREVVEEMAANGIREFLIHPVHGMEVEYLSQEFFDCYRYALSLARDHNLKVWVYDEYGWPSGNAGGLLLREHPEHKGWYLHFEKDAAGSVTAQPRQSDRILDNTMGAPWTQSESGYLDTLSTEAVRCFIEMTHERIRMECGELFEQAVVGFFTDEPVCMMDARNGRPGGWEAVGMPWTPELPRRFKELFGYDIEPLYTQMAGDGPSSVKRDYWQLVKDIYSEAYHGQIGRWCREHGLKYTGHVGEDRLLMQVRFSGSVYQCLKHMDEPGIDFLGAGPEPEHRFIDHVLVPSIARHSGKDRVYCEAYGISPFNIRLGEMLKRAQMFGIYGINDIALMGFQQSLDGVRKRAYWPPIFMEAPWWPFYPEFRDAFARSVGLMSLGVRKPRYAIVYPQNQLEQTDLFNVDMWEGNDLASKIVQQLGLAVYESGESFEFVFPEMLDQASVLGDRIVFPHADYEAILAPSDIAYFDESEVVLDKIASAGGVVLRGSVEGVAEKVRSGGPSWTDHIQIDGDFSPGDVRVFRFGYPDGELYAIRNVTDSSHVLKVSSSRALSEWDPTHGTVTDCGGKLERELMPHGTLYVTVSENTIGASASKQDVTQVPVEAQWTVTAEKPNMARLANMQFRCGESGWVDAVDLSIFGDAAGRSPTGVPCEFRGATRLEMRAEFDCGAPPRELGVLYESGHLESLEVNGTSIDLSSGSPLAVWDSSCRTVGIRDAARAGNNKVAAVISYKQFETSIANDAFFGDWCMPTCEVFFAGSFRLLGGQVVEDSHNPLSLPIDFSAEGWSEYDGMLDVACGVELDGQLAEKIVGLELELTSEDCMELILDGNVVGKEIVRPYRFKLDGLKAGHHTLSFRITGTSANLLSSPSGWGITAADWLIKS